MDAITQTNESALEVIRRANEALATHDFRICIRALAEIGDTLAQADEKLFCQLFDAALTWFEP